MLFNTPTYFYFLIPTLIAFYTLNCFSTRWRNIFLLAASWFFYAQLHWWYLLLLGYATVVNYVGGLWIERERERKGKVKAALWTTVILTLAALVVFKYFYIFNSNIMLPVGMSFFTFMALTYSIDIYRGKIHADKDLIKVALFISFFPTLLSGPIERARNMLPQLSRRIPFHSTNLIIGAQWFIWGLFKKIVIADRLADYVNMIYAAPEAHNGATLALAAFFYSFQIYCDFSGYADMAIGSGRMMGFRIMQNFRLPYCVRTIKEFWRRWHISLTSWFTEYVYISLGGNRVSKARWMLNISLVFILSGIWHGATAAFAIWGALHAVYYLLEKYFGPKLPNVLYHILIFILITFAWIFFRTEDATLSCQIIWRICTDFMHTPILGSSAFTTILTACLLLAFIVREFVSYRVGSEKRSIAEHVFLLIFIALFSVTSEHFVYFQF